MSDEVEAVEVGNDRRHRECEHPFAGQLARGSARGRLQLEILQGEPHPAKLFGQAGSRPRRVVGDEPEQVARVAELCDGFGRPGNRLSRDVEHAVDVQQNAGHGA